MSEGLHVTSRIEDDVLIITIKDPRLIDYDQVRAMRTEIELAIDESSTKLVAVDMSNVEMITSVAILPLVGGSGRARHLGGEAVFCNMSEMVNYALETCKLVVEHRSHSQQVVGVADLAIATLKAGAESTE